MGLREFLSILPEYTEDEDGSNYVEYPPHWWNWNREFGAERHRVLIGDLQADNEHESGEPAGFKFGVDLELFANTGQFDGWAWRTNDHFEDHDLSICFGRWGIYIAVRGRKRAC